ncbi:hypothetical protein HispidOSU_009727, partial [Sigmodon hispidus]
GVVERGTLHGLSTMGGSHGEAIIKAYACQRHFTKIVAEEMTFNFKSTLRPDIGCEGEMLYDHILPSFTLFIISLYRGIMWF